MRLPKALFASLIFIGTAYCGVFDMIIDKLHGADGIQNPVRGKFEFLGNLNTEYKQSSPEWFDRIVNGESCMFAIDNDNIIRDDKEVFNIPNKKITPTKRTQKLTASHEKAIITLRGGRILYFSTYQPPQGEHKNIMVQSFNKANYSFTKEAESVLAYINIRAKLLQLKDGNVLMVARPTPIKHKLSKQEAYFVAFEKYDPNSKKFTFLGTNNIPRSNFAVMQTPGDKVLIVGGYSDETGVKDPLEIEEYDPKTDRCRVIGKLLKTRTHPVVQLLPNGKILIMGGYQEKHNGYYASKYAELFDPKNGVSTPLPDHIWYAPEYATSYMVGDQVVILAGINAQGFDYKTNKFYEIDSVGSDAGQRSMFGCAVLPNGNAVVGGGIIEHTGKHSPRDIWLLRLR